MTKKDTLKQLIDEGELLIANAVNKNFLIEKASLANLITGEQNPPKYKYISIIGTLWKNNCITYLNYQLLNKDEKEKFEAFFPLNRILGNDISKTSMEQSLSHLKSLFEHYPFEESIILDDNTNIRIEKIFISHATKDKDYVKLFVQLLNDIGIPKDGEKIFCSSLAGYDVPLGKELYEYLKLQFDYDIRVVFALSKNYYNSAPCLNEMGATWVKAKEYTTIILPEFSFADIKGAIDPTKIGFFITDKERLNDLRKLIIGEFNLNETDQNIWERDRDKFISEVNKLIEENKSNNSSEDIEMKIVSVEEGNEGDNILLCTRIINSSNSTYKFKGFDLFLTDSSGEEERFKHKELIIIHDNENKIVNFTLAKTNERLCGDKIKDKKIEPIFI